MSKTNYSPTFPMFPGDAAAVTPSDTNDLRNPAVIYVGVIGPAASVKITTAQGTVVTFSGLLAGTSIPVQARRVWATGTDCTGLVAIF